jgi:hypothetical protein
VPHEACAPVGILLRQRDRYVSFAPKQEVHSVPPTFLFSYRRCGDQWICGHLSKLEILEK